MDEVPIFIRIGVQSYNGEIRLPWKRRASSGCMSETGQLQGEDLCFIQSADAPHTRAVIEAESTFVRQAGELTAQTWAKLS